jgi:uncharacterized membrane protein YfcA
VENFTLLNDLPSFHAILLIISAFFTSLITATVGAGGGVMLLGIMAQVLPPQVLIPVHGVVQLGSNGGRAILSWRHIDWQMIKHFLPGALVGGLIGILVLVTLPENIMYLSIAGFILFLCWGPKLPKHALGPIGVMTLGLSTTFLTLFLGATGPLVGAFIKQVHAQRLITIASFAAIMSLQHIIKIILFGYTGFNLMPWAGLIVAMVAAGALGTWLGLKIGKRFKDQQFQMLFNIVLSLLALRLIWQAIQPWIS